VDDLLRADVGDGDVGEHHIADRVRLAGGETEGHVQEVPVGNSMGWPLPKFKPVVGLSG